MSKIFKPRRGTSTTMSTTKASTVLASGEMFFELSSSGLGQPGVGIKMGDGTTAYSSLPYFIKSVNLSSDTITPATNGQTTSTAALNDVTSGKTIPQLIGALKNAISLTKTEVTTTIDEVVPFPLAIQNNIYGYKTTNGTFVAFREDSTGTYTYASGSTGGTVDLGARNSYRYVNATNVYNKGKADGTSNGLIVPAGKVLNIKYNTNSFLDFALDTSYNDIMYGSYIFNFSNVAGKSLYMACPYSSSYYWHSGYWMVNGSTITACTPQLNSGRIPSSWTKMYVLPSSGYQYFVVPQWGISSDNGTIIWMKFSNS